MQGDAEPRSWMGPTVTRPSLCGYFFPAFESSKTGRTLKKWAMHIMLRNAEDK